MIAKRNLIINELLTFNQMGDQKIYHLPPLAQQLIKLDNPRFNQIRQYYRQMMFIRLDEAVLTTKILNTLNDTGDVALPTDDICSLVYQSVATNIDLDGPQINQKNLNRKIRNALGGLRKAGQVVYIRTPKTTAHSGGWRLVTGC